MPKTQPVLKGHYVIGVASFEHLHKQLVAIDDLSMSAMRENDIPRISPGVCSQGAQCLDLEKSSSVG